MRPIENPSVERALPGLIVGAIAIVIAWPVAHLIGFAPIIDAVMAWAAATHYLALFSWYAGVFAGIGAILRGTAMLLGLHILTANVAINRLGWLFVAGVRGIKTVIVLIVQLLVGLPLIIAWEYGWKPLEDRIVAYRNGRAIERELRREYRAHYQDEYRTFAEFKRAYYGQNQESEHEEKEQQKKDEKKETVDPRASLNEAYALLGLTESCTKAELHAQYCALMKKVHPDSGGTPALAAKLNKARDLIIKQKGWKK